MRNWSFQTDMNHDSLTTISDVWLWFKWLYFYPGDGLLFLVIEKTPSIAKFFELSAASYGGVLSGIISFFAWVVLCFAITILENWKPENWKVDKKAQRKKKEEELKKSI